MMKIQTGDVQSVLRTQPANSFDAVLTDPPYGLGFMGKAWDHGVPGPEVWAEVLRVVKPGGFMFAFGGTRTYHRLACAIEDAGWEIRDSICCWMYGSGFPKSHNISKAIDQRAGVTRKVIERRRTTSGGTEHINRGNLAQEFRPGAYQKGENILDITASATKAARTFDGYGTALKPAWEPILVCMKPCDGTFAENASKWGIGGLNIDAGRIGSDQDCSRKPALVRNTSAPFGKGAEMGGNGHALGRWPANLILDEAAASELDQQSGILTSGNNPAKRNADKHRTVYAGWKGEQCLVHRGTDSGGASRFFYVAKASKRERGIGNTHPTVKPVALAKYLATLLLPPYQGEKRRLLVPFSGSGSELLGAKAAGWEYALGIDSNIEYAKIARLRISGKQQQPIQLKKAA